MTVASRARRVICAALRRAPIVGGEPDSDPIGELLRGGATHGVDPELMLMIF